jgi:hypothetical protein
VIGAMEDSATVAFGGVSNSEQFLVISIFCDLLCTGTLNSKRCLDMLSEYMKFKYIFILTNYNHSALLSRW